MPRSLRSQRGNALLFVTIALAVLAIIGLAAVEFTGRDMGVASTLQRKNAVDRCAAAARKYLTAQYRSSSNNVPKTGKLMVAFNAAGGDETVQLIQGQHVGGAVGPIPTHYTFNTVSTSRPKDLTNVFAGATSNGAGIGDQPVLCRELTPAFPDGGGRESEFELYVRVNL